MDATSLLPYSSVPSDVDVDQSDEANRSFVIYGVKAGTTTVTVFIDDELEATIPARVEPQ